MVTNKTVRYGIKWCTEHTSALTDVDQQHPMSEGKVCEFGTILLMNGMSTPEPCDWVVAEVMYTRILK